ncbi:hypothetical protein DV515_00018849 [Chloebia gouldiae]|uniref:Secreted protein n=1 Tax=Chloebia gouldiae TaxID=44316 RepID=A0A3L8Q6M8_CHLGU|nr:hypothetical protein DV515_00018849 [Chloebia gouldiae]
MHSMFFILVTMSSWLRSDTRLPVMRGAEGAPSDESCESWAGGTAGSGAGPRGCPVPLLAFPTSGCFLAFLLCFVSFSAGFCLFLPQFPHFRLVLPHSCLSFPTAGCFSPHSYLSFPISGCFPTSS